MAWGDGQNHLPIAGATKTRGKGFGESGRFEGDLSGTLCILSC